MRLWSEGSKTMVGTECPQTTRGGIRVFAGLKFLQRGQMHLEEAYITVYGGYSTRLLRLQLDPIQALDKHRRGHKQTVQARDVHIHSGGQGVVGIINSGKDGSEPAPDNSSQSES